MPVTIYHNPDCSKSRRTLGLIRDRGIEPVVVHYLETPPDEAGLRDLLARLGMTARELVRTGEPAYRDLGLDDAGADDDRIIAAMCATPRLIERPVVVTDRGARIGRPPEAVLDIL